MSNHNFEEMGLSITPIKTLDRLSNAFLWRETAQGFSFWSQEVQKGVLTEECLAAWEDLEDEYQQWLEARSQKLEEGWYSEVSVFGEWVVKVIETKSGQLLRVSSRFDINKVNPKITYKKLTYGYPFFAFDDSKFGTLEECAEIVFENQGRSEYHDMGGAFRSFLLKFPCNYHHMSNLCSYAFKAELNQEDPKKVDLYLNYTDSLRGRRTTMKYGRAIRHMIPQISDSDLESLVKDHLDVYAKRDYKLIVDNTRESFATAYSDKLSKSYNCETTASRKSLHNSCMRGVEVGGISPAEVYASGDFHIAYLTYGEEEYIAGRVVVRNATDEDRPQAGPVYGVCEHSLNMLEEYLDSINAVKYKDGSSWEGAKLLILECYDSLIAPYSDMEEGAEREGNYLVIDSSGSIGLTRTDGCADDGTHCCCDYCGYECNEEDMSHVDDYGHVCSECTIDHFVWSEAEYGYIHHDSAVLVFYRSAGRTLEEYRHIEADNMIYCECVDAHWDEDCITPTSDGLDFVPTHMVKDFPELFEEEKEEGEAA